MLDEQKRHAKRAERIAWAILALALILACATCAAVARAEGCAVLVVGETGTYDEHNVAMSELMADALEVHGVTVRRFYPPHGPGAWGQITAASQGAAFWSYRGHTSPDNNPLLWLGPGNSVYADDVRGLHLAEDAAVFLYGCGTFGEIPGDNSRMPPDVVARRVLAFAEPFGHTYFSSAWGATHAEYVKDLLNGVSPAEAFRGHPYPSGQTVVVQWGRVSLMNTWWVGPSRWVGAFVENPAEPYTLYWPIMMMR